MERRWARLSKGTGRRCGLPVLAGLILATLMLPACATQAVNPVKATAPASTEAVPEGPEQPQSLPRASAAGPLTLDQVIEEALTASPELEQIERRLGAVVEQVRQAEAAFYPRLVLTEEFNTTNNPMFALMNLINQRRLEPTVDFNDLGQQQNVGTKIQGEWAAFTGGSRYFGRKAAAGQRDAVEAEQLAARNQLVARVTQTYYQWLQALGFIAVAELALDAAKTDEQLGETRLQVGMALDGEVLRLRARRAEAQGNLVSARTSARRLQAAVERLIARPIGSEEVPNPALSLDTGQVPGDRGGHTADPKARRASEGKPPRQERDASAAPSAVVSPPFPPGAGRTEGKTGRTGPATGSTPDAATLVQTALANRPEMASVRALIESARNRVRAAQGGLLPRIGGTAHYQWDAEELGDDAAESWMVAVQATWPLFEGGLTVAQIREAQARFREVEARGEQMALDIALEVHQAVLTIEEMAEKIKVADQRRQWARQALEETRHLYANQVVTVDALLHSEAAWSQAEVAHTAALFEGKIAQAMLRQALGDFARWMEARNE